MSPVRSDWMASSRRSRTACESTAGLTTRSSYTGGGGWRRRLRLQALGRAIWGEAHPRQSAQPRRRAKPQPRRGARSRILAAAWLTSTQTTTHPQERILVLGEGRLIDVVRRVLDDAAADVIHLRAPNDREIRRALTPDIDAVVVISRDDRVSLRLALVVEGVRPGVRLIVTIYNRDLAAQVRRAVRNVRVMSMADIVAPALAGPCLGEDLVAVSRSPRARRGAARRARRRRRAGARAADAARRAPRRPPAGERRVAAASLRAQREDPAGRPARLRRDPADRRDRRRPRAARAGAEGRVPRDAGDRDGRPERGHRPRARSGSCRSRR